MMNIKTALLILFIANLLSAQHLGEKNVSESLNESELILKARVVSTQSNWITDSRGKHIYTSTEFQIIETVKGNYFNSRINLDLPGGKVGDITEYVSNSFSPKMNDELILMLSQKNAGNQYHLERAIRIMDNQIFLATRFVSAATFTSFLKSRFSLNKIIPENIDQLQEQIDTFEMKKNIFDKTLLKKDPVQVNANILQFANLAPYTPLEWSDKIVTSIVQGTNTDATVLRETDKIYTDWSIANFGFENITTQFLINLYVDDLLYAQWSCDNLPAGYYVYVSDYQIDPLRNGTHTIKIKIDPTNVIEETNETDNEYVKTITVQTVPGLPAITGITPSSAPAGTGTIITISGNNFGSAKGTSKVEFFYKTGEPKIESTRYVSWSDTRIECEVPIGIINDYPASASSGPILISTTNGTSAGYNYNITFGYGQIKWNGSPALVPLKINSNTNDLTDAGSEIISAASAWTSAGAKFGFYYNGSTTITNSTYNGSNEIVWGTTDNSLATAYYWFDNNSMIEADIVFNDNYNWSKNSTAVDVNSVALHELGHWLSLRDLYGGTDLEKVMYGFTSSGSLKRILSIGEIEGVKWIYGTGSSPLMAPSLLLPQNNLANAPKDILLKWDKVVGSGAVFRIQVSTDPSFSSTIVDAGNLSSYQYQLNNLLYKTKYYWRVSTSNSVNSPSGWSNVWSFTTLAQSFTITCTANPVQGGTVTGGGTFTDGTQITVTAIPSSGYRFLNWTEGGILRSASSDYALVVTADKILTANFELIPIITVIQPNGGENWQAQSEHEIKWSSVNVQYVKIEYSTNNGVDWNIISNSLAANLGKVNWNLPNEPSAIAKVRVSDASNILVSDISDNVFTILPLPFITLLIPNGSETWNRNTIQEIKWNSSGIQNVKIEYSINNGSSWQTISNAASASEGKYNWTLPDVQTRLAKIRVTDISNSLLTDQSDNSFIIGPLPIVQVVSPNGNETWLAGLEYQIKWSSQNVNNIKIEFSLNNGSTWSIISNSVSTQNGFYNWLIPNVNSVQGLVRISDENNLSSDASDNNFTLVEAQRGDLDGNGILTSDDGIFLLKSIVGLESLSQRQLFSADVDQNGLIQAYDAFYILFYLFFGIWPQ